MSPTDISKRVLIVDDEPDICNSLSEALQSEGWVVRCCLDGAAVLPLVREFDPAVVILDLKMPKVDGVKVLLNLREASPWVQTVVLTGHGGEEDAIACLNGHAFGYLQKPASRESLLQMCDQALKNVPPALLGFHRWYQAISDPDRVLYTTAAGQNVTARQLCEEIRQQTPLGQEFIGQVTEVAAELIVKRL